MSISDVFSMLGGLALFLYGMRMMREYLELAAEGKLPGMLKRLTGRPLPGFLAGTGITAVVQSSTAVMVLLIGFADAGIVTLTQTVWVILGANIGTTVTSQLTALNIKGISPLFAFAGLLLLTSKKERNQRAGGILSGLGIMFIGLSMVETSMRPLGGSRLFCSLLTRCGNPLTGILAGTVFTALLQSSTASVGILQALANNGLVDIRQSIFIVFGQNIGTCFTALLAAGGASVNAKRTAVLHLLINLLGTVLFLLLGILLPFSDWMEHLAPGQPARQIANVHTIFNVATSLVLLPFGGLLVKIAGMVVPEQSSWNNKK